jgi:hypothetical protein
MATLMSSGLRFSAWLSFHVARLILKDHESFACLLRESRLRLWLDAVNHFAYHGFRELTQGCASLILGQKQSPLIQRALADLIW